jgi:hypothetical protein
MSYANNTLSTSINGTYQDINPLANITVAGLNAQPNIVSISLGGKQLLTSSISQSYSNGTLFITGVSNITGAGLWSGDLEMSLSPGMETTVTSGIRLIRSPDYIWMSMLLAMIFAFG